MLQLSEAECSVERDAPANRPNIAIASMHPFHFKRNGVAGNYDARRQHNLQDP